MLSFFQDKDEITNKSFKACGEELNIDLKSDIEEGKLKCFFKCFLEKEGVMKDGVIDKAGAEKAIQSEDQVKDKAKATAAVPGCMEQAKVGDDCEKASDFATCIMNASA